MAIEAEIRAICARARAASRLVGPLPREKKDHALLAIAAGVRTHRESILEANRQDLEGARARGTKGALLDRLELDAARVEAVAKALEEIAALPDPVGETISKVTRPNGLRVTRARAPLGVIAIVYEARPNVTAEASALCLKAGNAVVLRGGSEAKHSNAALGAVISEALEASGLPRDAVQLVPFTDHDAVRILVQQSDTIDLAIPRGGEAL
ncbi:MAG: aldehyde dehydrogenase family protein, partial [Polyangiaceae bacterium]